MGNQSTKEKKSKLNREILVDALKRAYHRKYTHIKPVPFEAVSLYVSDVYTEGAIKVLDRSKGEKDPCRWTAIQSRHDLFKPLKDLDGTRILIDGEPGYGKSTLLRQYAHDFINQSPESPLKRFSIFVLLPLRELCNVKCIYQAIRSQLPDDNPLTAEAIKDVIKDNVSALLIGFDGFDEYSDRGSPQSFVAQIMNNKLLEQCTAICSTRMGCSLPLPSPTMKHFRLSGFNYDMQKAYIKNAFRSTENAGVLKDRILRQLQQNPAFDAIFKVPLFFVVFAHIRGNEEIMENLDTVTGFFAHMMKTLLDHQRNKDAPDQHIDSLLEPLLRQLAELAFNGLCSQNQKVRWEASELNQLIDKATLEMYTNSGILVREEMPYTPKTPGANESFWETSQTHFRFFHKIFQEYFAAFHISGLAKQEDTKHLAKKALVNLNHIELQYVYRFACGLNKATAKIILDLFTKNSKASRIFATLCLLETDSEDKYNEVREYCCSGLVVNHYDSKSLQTSTIQLLQVASHQKIPLPSLELSCCVKSVNLEQETLLLFSGLVISKLDTVEELTLTFTNCVDMAASLLGLFSKIPVLKAVRFKHCKLPRSFDDGCVLSDLESNQCEVSWKNLSLEVKLNLSTGRWEKANGNEMTDEDYERMLCEAFSLGFEGLKRKVAEILPQNSCAKIARLFSLQEDEVAEISGHKSSTSDLLDVLEERGYIHAANISPLLKSLCELKMTDSVLEIAESYQNSIGTETSYDQFLASLSSHLTLSYPEKLCDHFEFSVVEKKEIVESDTPGIALLLTLNKRGLINATTVGKLVEPLTKYTLVQPVAKVKEYQSMVDRSGEKTTVATLMFDKEKRQSYIENIIPTDKQLEFTQAVVRSSALRDLCSTHLISAFIVHNMASWKLDQIHMKSVGSIMEEMINIIFSQAGSECKESNMLKVEEHSERLSEIAFNGLCRGCQQLQWPKTFFDKSIPNVKQWLNSGLLILEEPLREGKDQQTIERDATGSDAMRSKETFEQSNQFEQVIENATTTKRGKKRRIHAHFEESLCREGVQHVKRKPPEELPKATCSSPFGISYYPKRSMITADQLYPGKVYPQVKFIHKIIQEWFAAKHLFVLLSQAIKRDTIDSVLTKHIPLIKPADLYIIRFTSYLCPRSCPAIVKSLMDRHRSSDGVVPENILNIAFLCFAELDEQTDNAHTKETVNLLTAEPVIIRGEENKLLQQSKISVLTYAVNNGIEVGCLKLINIVVNVNWNRLIFNSGLAIELLPTLNILEIYGWDQRLSEREENLDYQNLIEYISNLASLKKAYLHFPVAPPAIPVFTKASIEKRMIEIKWVLGSFTHTLDWKTAKVGGQTGDGLQDHKTVKDDRPDPKEHDGSTSTGNQIDRAVQTEAGDRLQDHKTVKDDRPDPKHDGSTSTGNQIDRAVQTETDGLQDHKTVKDDRPDPKHDGSTSTENQIDRAVQTENEKIPPTLDEFIETGDGSQDHNTGKDYAPDPREHDGSTRTGNLTKNEQTPPTRDEFIKKISGEITEEWRLIGRNLGLTELNLNVLDKKFGGKTKILGMFTKWTQIKGNEATFLSLKTALKDAERKDLSDKITWL